MPLEGLFKERKLRWKSECAGSQPSSCGIPEFLEKPWQPYHSFQLEEAGHCYLRSLEIGNFNHMFS